MHERDSQDERDFQFWERWRKHLSEAEMRANRERRLAELTSMVLRVIVVAVLWLIVVWPMPKRPLWTAILMAVFVMSQVAVAVQSRWFR